MCIGYHALNKKTIKNLYLILRIENLLDELGGLSYFSKRYLRSGYHQIGLRLEDEYKISFFTYQGLYKFHVMPFGLTNSHDTFQNIMNQIFRRTLPKGLIVYFNEIFIYSNLWYKHLDKQKEVIGILQEHSLLYTKHSLMYFLFHNTLCCTSFLFHNTLC